MRTLNIDPEFESLIPPLTDEEFNQLEANIVKDGIIRDPIVLQNDTQTIVDGHNRYRIAMKHPEIPFDTIEHEFSCREEVVEWICSNQLGRRNITDVQRVMLLGRAYEARKTMSAKTMERTPDGRFIAGSTENTAETLAKEMKTSETKVKRSSRFVRGLNEIEAVYPGTTQKINNGELEVTMADVMALTNMPEEDKPEAMKAIVEGKRIKSYVDTPMATQVEHTSSYTVEDFRSELSRKVIALDKGLELTVVLTHKEMLNTEEGKDALKDTLLAMTEVIRKYLELC